MCHDQLKSSLRISPTPGNAAGLHNSHSSQGVGSDEPPPPPASYTRREDVEELRPQKPARNIPFLLDGEVDKKQQNRDCGGVNQPETNVIIYAELAVSVRPERIHRSVIADPDRAVYASIDHRISTRKNMNFKTTARHE
jgi:hypothetical protein